VEHPVHYQFVVSGAVLRAAVYGIASVDVDVKDFLKGVTVPPFVPRSGVKIQVSEGETVGHGDDDGPGNY
jgi:ubiquitin-activating enzyme E1